jgi:tetratricopeptide (TPR) repeat protein
MIPAMSVAADRSRSGLAALLLAFDLLLLPFLFWGLHAADTDTFYHLASGRWMFENARVLDHEVFSFAAPGRAWVNCYWLFQWVLYGAYALGGYPGVLVLRALVLLATFDLLLAWIWKRTGGAWAETLTFSLLAFSLVLPRALNFRGHLFSYLFLLALLWRLDRFAAGGRRFDPALPLLCALWANVHGVAFPIALAAIGVFATAALVPHVDRPVREIVRDPSLARWALLLVACALAFAATPFGFSLYGTLFLAGQEEVLSQIAEMSPHSWASLSRLVPDLELWSLTIFSATLLPAALLVPRWVRRRDVLALGCVALGAGLALYKSRFTAEFMILAVPFVAAAVAEMRARKETSRRAGRLLAVAAAYLVLAILLKLGRAFAGGEAFALLDGQIHPVGPVRLMQEQRLQGNLLANPTSAGYVTWALHPSRVRVFADMRAPILFTAQELWLYKAVGDTVTLADFRRRYPLDFLLLERHAPLAEAVLADPSAGFAPVWADPKFVLLVSEERLRGLEELRLRTLPALLRLEAGGPLGAGDDPARTEAEAARLAATWPANHLAQSALVRIRLALGRPAEALELARALAGAHPRAAVYPYLAGQALQALGRPAEAVRSYDEARRREPGYLPAYPALAGTLALGEETARARRVMEEYARRQRFRLSAPEHLLLAALRHRDGAFAPAADACERALWQLPEGAPLRAEAIRGLERLAADPLAPAGVRERARAGARAGTTAPPAP